MNNKRLGMAFEQDVCRLLREKGWWVHFISPDARGAQPFDIIAVKDGVATAIDCKTSSKAVFPISRLEDNQVFAFERWIACGNLTPTIWVLYDDSIHVVSYAELKEKGKIDLESRSIE